MGSVLTVRRGKRGKGRKSRKRARGSGKETYVVDGRLQDIGQVTKRDLVTVGKLFDVVLPENADGMEVGGKVEGALILSSLETLLDHLQLPMAHFESSVAVVLETMGFIEQLFVLLRRQTIHEELELRATLHEVELLLESVVVRVALADFDDFGDIEKILKFRTMESATRSRERADHKAKVTEARERRETGERA
jgi:hypothetical protein